MPLPTYNTHRAPTSCTRRTLIALIITSTIAATTLADRLTAAAHRSPRDLVLAAGTAALIVVACLLGWRLDAIRRRQRTAEAEQHAVELEAARRDNELARHRLERDLREARAEIERLRAQVAIYDEEADREMWEQARRNRADAPTIAFNQVVRPLVQRNDRAS